MQNKRAVYLLLPAVLIIWGLIGFKVYQHLSESEQEFKPIEVQIKKVDTVRTAPLLTLNYPDPFLKSLGKSQISKTSTVAARPDPKPKKQEKQVKSVETIKQPKLSYGGVVENRKSKDQRHIISVNGDPKVVVIGQENDGVVLKKVMSDSVMFIWRKQTIYVKR